MNKDKIANLISNLAHPLLTFPVFIGVMLFLNETFTKALWLSALILLGIFVPVTLKLYLGTKKGKYTNFDVSDREQRKGFFPTLIVLFALIIGILYITGQSSYILKPFLFAFLLIGICYVCNFYIKVSLHTSLTLFLGFLILPVNLYLGIGFLVFTLLMAWSRLHLKRHSLQEILLGGLIGVSVGIGYLITTI
jgi:membrane-associated phospholipid phosphatase